MLICLSLTVVWAADETDVSAQVQANMTALEGSVTELRQNVDDLEANFVREIDERERLMLQRRFVEGREFFFMLHDYRGAAELFWGVVHHPIAPSMPNYLEAVYYLADSLFHCRFYSEARQHYQMILKAGRTDYYGISLMRLIEIAVVQHNYSEADRLYMLMLSDFPEEEDGSLGRYIIGKSFYLRGETAKSIEILDSIPESGNYYATAQYFIAVIYVKQRNYREAVNRLRRLKQSLDDETVNREQIYALTNLALGRIYYELNDFPQAMARYLTVPPESEEYPRALYESMWVFITRNDYLLQAIEAERNNYEDLLFSYADFRDVVNYENQQQGGLEQVVTETEQLQTELDEMQTMFTEIDQSLTRLQEEAVASFNNLVENAPHHELLPEAELLVGNIYSQVEDVEQAESWFTEIRTKYENFYNAIAAARPNMGPQDHLDVLSAGHEALNNDAPVDQFALRGLPEEVAYWLAAKPQLQKLFALYDAALKERENLYKMRQIVQEIESKLSEMEANIGGYPILRESRRRSVEYKDQIQAMQVEIAALQGQAQQVPDDTLRSQALAAAGSYNQTLNDLQSRLIALDDRIEAKKNERLAYYRQELATLRSPLYEYSSSVDAMLARASDVTAREAARQLEEIERKVYEYVERADLGIIDVAWRATRGSGREIRDIQRQLQEELRQFQRMQWQSEQPAASQPAPATEEPAAEEPAPATEEPAADTPDEQPAPGEGGGQ